MKLSAPIHQLKRRAKRLARQQDIPLHQALDRTARDEGFAAWSLLAATAARPGPTEKLLDRLVPGDLVLIGARPGQGKTLMSLRLAADAMKAGHHSMFFTLEYTEKDVCERFRAIGIDSRQFGNLFCFDGSDVISADHIMRALAAAPRGTLAVVDYLQLLDQRRDNPDLLTQVRQLKSFARARGVIIVFISQIDRSYEPAVKPCPDLSDVRLANPLDLRLFDKTCFLNAGTVRFQAAA